MNRRSLAAAATTAAVVTLAPAASADAAACRGADAVIDDRARDRARAENALECLIDRHRAAHGRHALGASSRLTEVAVRHARDMTRRNYLAHVTPGGRDVLDRVRRYTSYIDRSRSYKVGEVIAYQPGRGATARGLFSALLQSRTHRRVILTSRMRHVGVEVRDGSPRRGRGGTTVVGVVGDR